MSRNRGGATQTYVISPPIEIVLTEGVKGRARLPLSFHSSDNEMTFSAAATLLHQVL